MSLFALIDTPFIYRYKGVMKSLRTTAVICISLLLTACELAGLPTIPPGWTLTPSITPTFIASPTPTISPTPIPIVRVDAGEKALFNGDYPTALIHFQTAFRDSSDPVVRAAAKWGEARTQYNDERYGEAQSALHILITEFPDSRYLASAQFLLSLAQFKLGQYQAAADAWQAYLILRPGIIDSYTQELRGDSLFLAGSYPEALSAYTAAIQAPRLEDTAPLDLKAADTRAKLGDYDAALALYDAILARQVNDFLKAQAVYESGLVYLDQGKTEEAFGKFRFAVENYPLSYYSYLGLVKLVEAEAEVDDLYRGLVDYFAGQHDGALMAFDRYLAENQLNDGTAHYYRGLTLKALGNPESADLAFETFIENYPTHPRWEKAWEDKAETEWQDRGFSGIAAQTYSSFADTVPASPLAPDYLMRAARILEIDDHLDQAAEMWERVAADYPGNDQAPTALFNVGIIRYRQDDYEGALASFNRSLATSQRSEDRARAYLWIGKSQNELGDLEAATTAWKQGQVVDPGGYYSERARDLLSERPPFEPPNTTNLTPDLAAERADADSWVRLTFNLAADTDLNGPGLLAEDPRFIRGTEFWNLGLYEEARLEFESLRSAVSTSVVDTYRLANYLLDLGLYRSAITAVRETLTLAGLDEHMESMMAPPYFSHVRYGLYYSALVIPAAQEEGIDPLLIFSVMRQESLFEGFVKSTAGASGLMQIMPGTGSDIAGQLGWPIEYKTDQLIRPDVSIRFGTHYLGSNLRALEGDMYSALAAYNAGPGFAVIWKPLAADDLDLFLEVVRAEETRTYIRNIYEIYLIYKRLYGQPT